MNSTKNLKQIALKHETPETASINRAIDERLNTFLPLEGTVDEKNLFQLHDG